MATLSVAPRFCGPPGTANGGYIAGLLVQHSTQPLRVRLHQPIPLNTPLTIEDMGDSTLQLRHGAQLLARAQVATLILDIPTPPDYPTALEAQSRFIGFGRHAYPGCFVCGTGRAHGDGLRIFAGELMPADGSAATGLVAAPWVPEISLAADDGRVRPEFMAAALDCPGYFAARSDGAPMLLGEITARVERRVRIGEPCVVIGWRIAVGGRKYEVGTALFGEDGELCGCAHALWIEPRNVVEQ